MCIGQVDLAEHILLLVKLQIMSSNLKAYFGLRHMVVDSIEGTFFLGDIIALNACVDTEFILYHLPNLTFDSTRRSIHLLKSLGFNPAQCVAILPHQKTLVGGIGLHGTSSTQSDMI